MTSQPTTLRGVWQLRWRNPHKPRPEGFPEVMLRIEVPMQKGQGAGRCPTEIDEAWQELSPYGYGVSWHLEGQPRRELSLATKQRIRRRNLWKRLLKKYPLFVSDWYAEQVQQRADYYGEFVPGEFADVVFVRSTMGALKLAKESA